MGDNSAASFASAQAALIMLQGYLLSSHRAFVGLAAWSVVGRDLWEQVDWLKITF